MARRPSRLGEVEVDDVGVGGGTREIPASKLAALARLYAVPVERFMEPAPTAFEAIDEWLTATVIAASALERADWARAKEASQGPGDEPAAGPGKRSA
jgi:hypothetical protein